MTALRRWRDPVLAEAAQEALEADEARTRRQTLRRRGLPDRFTRVVQIVAFGPMPADYPITRPGRMP